LKVSKILEKHIQNQLFSFSVSSNVLPDCQSGFRKNFSTSTSLIGLLNDIRCNQDNKNITCLGILDFSKAFDTINHEMLLSKLHYFGLSNASIQFFRSYLSNRAHCVQLIKDCHSFKSSFLNVRYGVPQGSILGPLLFSIYVSDMYSWVKYCKLRQYADDSQLYISFLEEQMQLAQTQFNKDLKLIKTFAYNHNLKLNAAKSSVIFFGATKHKLQRISENFFANIDGTPLPIVSEVKILGIFLDSELSFHTHVSRKLSTAYMRFKKLCSVKKFLTPKAKYFLCNSLILSIFDYGD